MKRFAIALTVFVAAAGAAGAALAQTSIAEQMRRLREQRVGAVSQDGAQTANLDGAALAGAKGCMQCHSGGGPGAAWRDIAARYKYSADDIVRLMERMLDGTVPEHKLMNEEEAKKLVIWILKTQK